MDPHAALSFSFTKHVNIQQEMLMYTHHVLQVALSVYANILPYSLTLEYTCYGDSGWMSYV